MAPGDETGALDGQIAAAEKGKKWADLARLLEQRAAVAADPAERSALLGRAARVFTEQFSNGAEAARLGDLVMATGRLDAPTAELLRGLYQKRRDKARLAQLESIAKGG